MSLGLEHGAIKARRLPPFDSRFTSNSFLKRDGDFEGNARLRSGSDRIVTIVQNDESPILKRQRFRFLMCSPIVSSREVIVNLENGLHMSPSAQIVQTSQSFDCDVSIRNGDRKVDAKSMLDLLTLAAEKGAKLVIEASGNGAEQAIDALERLFKSNFSSD